MWGWLFHKLHFMLQVMLLEYIWNSPRPLATGIEKKLQMYLQDVQLFSQKPSFSS